MVDRATTADGALLAENRLGGDGENVEGRAAPEVDDDQVRMSFCAESQVLRLVQVSAFAAADAARNSIAASTARAIRDASPRISRFSLAPGFSRVWRTRSAENRFNGFSRRVEKAAEAAAGAAFPNTRLKPGANEKAGPRLERR